MNPALPCLCYWIFIFNYYSFLQWMKVSNCICRMSYSKEIMPTNAPSKYILDIRIIRKSLFINAITKKLYFSTCNCKIKYKLPQSWYLIKDAQFDKSCGEIMLLENLCLFPKCHQKQCRYYLITYLSDFIHKSHIWHQICEDCDYTEMQPRLFLI